MPQLFFSVLTAMLFHFLSSSYYKVPRPFFDPPPIGVCISGYVGPICCSKCIEDGHSAASGFGEKADSVIAVKRNAEFNAAVNATIIYVTTSGCRCIYRLANAALHIYCSNTNFAANSCWLNSHKVYFSSLFLQNSSRHLIINKHDIMPQ